MKRLFVMTMMLLLAIPVLSSTGDKIYIPSDSRATYIEIQKTKIKGLALLQSMRGGSSGKSAMTTIFNCRSMTYENVVDLDINNKSDLSKFTILNNEAMGNLPVPIHKVVNDSITYYKMQHACK